MNAEALDRLKAAVECGRKAQHVLSEYAHHWGKIHVLLARRDWLGLAQLQEELTNYKHRVSKAEAQVSEALNKVQKADRDGFEREMYTSGAHEYVRARYQQEEMSAPRAFEVRVQALKGEIGELLQRLLGDARG